MKLEYSMKKSCESNSWRNVGVVTYFHNGKPNAKSFIDLILALAAEIIFWASESCDRFGSKQPRRVFNPTTATAAFNSIHENDF